MSESIPFPEDPFDLLENGRIEGIELIPWGSNYTFATVLKGYAQEQRCYGVYKPRRGEVPLRDFPSGTLYKREVAAYVFAKHLGWDIVPPTVIRQDGPHGIGSLQLYVEPRPDAAGQFDRLRETHRCDLQRLALFDLLTNNADRKGGHCLLDVRGQVWGIDHGLTFHHVSKLRTVIWDFCGDPFPPELVDELEDFRGDESRTQALREALNPLLSDQELDALFHRWDRLLAVPCYPQLDPYRNVPWPPF
jgi:hypothetical protein